MKTPTEMQELGFHMVVHPLTGLLLGAELNWYFFLSTCSMKSTCVLYVEFINVSDIMISCAGISGPLAHCQPKAPHPHPHPDPNNSLQMRVYMCAFEKISFQ